MKLCLSLALLALLLLLTLGAPTAAAAGSDDDPRTTAPTKPDLAGYGHEHVLHGGVAPGGEMSRAAGDTFYLYGGPGTSEGKFQDATGLIPDLQDWTTVDRTEQETYWQVSTWQAANLNDNGEGNRAYWCGRSAEQEPGWAAAPGYGNGWFAPIEYESAPLADPSVGQTVSLDFFFNQDTEPGYDFFEVEYDSAGTWKSVYSESGYTRPDHGDPTNPPPGEQFSTVSTPIVYTGNDYSAGGTIRVRMVFSSDGAWSDEDGLWPTEGAVQLDDITLVTSQGSFSEDFEGGGPYLFEPTIPPFAGDFAAVYARVEDLDPCAENTSPVLGFVDTGQQINNAPGPDGVSSTGGSLSPNWDYGVPGGWVVNHTGGVSFGTVALSNEAWSPEIPWDLPGSEDDAVDVVGARVRFSVWQHLPLLDGIFHVWHVRSRSAQDAVWSNWQDRNFVYYGAVPTWINRELEIGDLLVPDPDAVQFAMGVVDLAEIFFFPGDDATPSPFFDNVAVKKYRVGGVSLTTRNIDLAQDAFPASASIDASSQVARDALDVRFDMARDIATQGLAIDPGDSIIVDAVSTIPGADLSDLRMKWALRRNPLFEDAIRQAPSRPEDQNVDTSDPAVWTGEVVASQATTSTGAPVADRWFFDLPDQDFLYPGDQLHYFVQATDTDGRVTTLPADTSGFGAWSTAGTSSYERAFVVRALPTLESAFGDQPRLLVVNDFGHQGGGENEWLLALAQLGMLEGRGYDSYTVKGPSSLVSNGIGASAGHGATADQLAGYRSILYLGGTLRNGLLSNGAQDGSNDKSDDLGVLTSWYALPGDRHGAFFGNYIGSGLVEASPEGSTFVQTILGTDVLSDDVAFLIDDQVAPVVVPDAAGTFSTSFVAFGGCPQIDQFDALEPLAGAVAGHRFLDPAATPYTSPVASVVFSRTDGLGDRKLSLTFPFGFSSVWQRLDGAGTPGVRRGLMDEILDLFGESPSFPAVDAPPVRPADLGLEVAPNPFNPRTTITLRMPVRGHARVRVYDLRGQLVRTLIDAELGSGAHPLTWDGRDGAGAAVASGVYLVRAVAADQERTLKSVLVK